jgi:hypothetical protein
LKELPMRSVIALSAAVFVVALAQVVWGEPPGKERGQGLPALGQKLLGTWKGQTGCDGRFVFHANGTYELTAYGPAADDSQGVWKLRGNSLPATLVLTCTTSEIPEEIGKATEVRLINLDDRSLAIEYANPNGSPPGHYTRTMQ